MSNRDKFPRGIADVLSSKNALASGVASPTTTSAISDALTGGIGGLATKNALAGGIRPATATSAIAEALGGGIGGLATKNALAGGIRPATATSAIAHALGGIAGSSPTALARLGTTPAAFETHSPPSVPAPSVSDRARAPADALAVPHQQRENARKLNRAADLGIVVRDARRALGLNQQDFADLAGVGRRFVSELEGGKPSLEFDKVLRCCAAAGIDILAAPRRLA